MRDRLATPGATRGLARNDVRQLLERLGNHLAGRPTVLVWAKSDHAIADEMRAAIRGALAAHAPGAVEVETTTERPESLAMAVEFALRAAWQPAFALKVEAPALEPIPFAVYRGCHATS